MDVDDEGTRYSIPPPLKEPCLSAKRQQRIDDFEDTLGLEDAARMMRLGLEAMKGLVDKGEVPPCA